MAAPQNKLRVVDRTKMEFVDNKQERTYYRNTHPELATLAGLVADLPSDVYPLIDNLGYKEDNTKKAPLSKCDIDDAISGDVTHQENSYWFKVQLAGSLAFMLGIIAVYVTATIALGVFIFSSAQYFITGLSSGDSSILISKGLFAVLSSLLLIGMIKAIIMKRQKKATKEITRKREPVFFYYLETLCKSLDCPMPKRVFLSCNVDVTCHYHSKFSKDIDIYIGLPLISGFTTKELAGILVHELARFNIHNSSYLADNVRTLYLWLGQVCCHQDTLDKYIYALNKKIKKSHFKLPLIIIQLFFKIPRLILHALMWLTHLVCQFGIYKIDYESDYYEMQFAGNKKFEEIAYNIQLMSQTSNNTHSGLQVSKNNSTLHEDLPGHIAATTILLNEEKQQIIEKFKSKKSRITEIHPAFKKRMAKVDKFHNPGIFSMDVPSVRLFLNLKSHKRYISLEQYNIYFGKQGVNLESLKSTEIELRDMNELSRDWGSIERFYHGVVSFERIPIVDRKCPLNAKNWIQALRNLKQTHEHIKVDSAGIEGSQKEYEQAIGYKRLLTCARDYFSHNRDSNLTMEVMGKRINRKNISKILEGYSNRVEQENDRLTEFNDLCSARICYAIQLLNRKEFRAKITDGEIFRRNLAHILHYLRIYDHIKPALLSLRNNFLKVKFLIEQNESNFELKAGLEQRRTLLHKCLKKLELKLTEIPYPFTHSEKYRCLTEYVGVDIDAAKDFTGLMYVAEESYEKATSVYFKVLAKLIYMVEQIEQCAGLETPQTNYTSFNLSRTCG